MTIAWIIQWASLHRNRRRRHNPTSRFEFPRMQRIAENTDIKYPNTTYENCAHFINNRKKKKNSTATCRIASTSAILLWPNEWKRTAQVVFSTVQLFRDWLTRWWRGKGRDKEGESYSKPFDKSSNVKMNAHALSLVTLLKRSQTLKF